MEKSLYKIFYEFEEKHWWFRAARKIQLNLLKRYLFINKPKILDIGSGTGATLKELSKIGRTIGIDSYKEAIHFCHKRELKNVMLGDATKLPFKDSSYDCVTAFDVIEHIKDDVLVMKEIYRVLKPKGIAIITVPAFSFLWDSHDDMNKHYRRYFTGELKSKINRTDLNILYISYYNFFLFPIALVVKFIMKSFKKKRVINNQELIEPLNSFLYNIFLSEKYFLPLIKFPFGVSIICVSQKS